MAVPTGRVLTSWRCSMGPTWHSPTTHEGSGLHVCRSLPELPFTSFVQELLPV
jgi:hypothetical protein